MAFLEGSYSQRQQLSQLSLGSCFLLQFQKHSACGVGKVSKWDYIQLGFSFFFLFFMLFLALHTLATLKPKGCNATCVEPLFYEKEGHLYFSCSKWECIDRAFKPKSQPDTLAYCDYFCSHNIKSSCACEYLGGGKSG